MCLNMADVELI
uniref:Uncharacterized protein n=1 Tax=Anguilla anguilla TaxID=7936 RepID=A0A0E9PZD2_ANGAN